MKAQFAELIFDIFMTRNSIVLLLLLCVFEISAQPVKLPEAKHKFIIIAHRGDHVQFPENTLAAFESAISLGVDYVEIDLRTTKDSVLVIMHDATVDRMTNGHGRVSDLTYADIRQLKIVDKGAASFRTYSIPSFEEVLKICKHKIYIYLDFKDADVAQSFALIKKYGMENHMIIYINQPFQYTQWRKLAPAIPLMISLPDDISTEEALRSFLAEHPVAMLDGYYMDYTQSILKAAERLGITVWPDIQGPDEDKHWDKALDTGFKGLQTDHPRALIHYLISKKLR